MPRLTLTLEPELLDHLAQYKPKRQSLSAFCADLIEQNLLGLDRASKLPAYRVGAGNTGHTATETDSAPLPQQSWVEDRLSPEKTFTDLPSHIDLGDGVGRESEGGPRKGDLWIPRNKKDHLPSIPRTKVKNSRDLRGNLLAHDDLIKEFWQIKGGSRGDRAWALLQTELTKIQEKHGDAVVRQQLELAINGKWKGVTLANLERFDAPGGQRGQTGSAAPKTPQQLIVESVIRKHQEMEGNRAPF
jgi:hypothetical protein